ncbi:MAG: hypothetical protein CM15mP49_13830 [Actinomycetota bacterium]|nr:MAG: hypothetical protein CM15mP49_13830 [Actinomycetota bacterium]
MEVGVDIEAGTYVSEEMKMFHLITLSVLGNGLVV